jgi:hypothetical protein
MTQTYASIGVQIPEIYLPGPGVDYARWAVIACDQFTSQPDYWHKVEKLVGDEPSALNLIFPEVYLEDGDEETRIQRIQAAMHSYLEQHILQPFEGLLLVERTIGGKTRRGLMMALDLERYDYNKGSQSLIRATEGTIIERLPPRIKIRFGAPLELPHILVLIDDPQRTVIEPLAQRKNLLTKLYDFELMQGSGHLAGHLVDSQELETQAIQALEKLADPAAFAEKYGVGSSQQVLLFAMGDGNHSLATAKAIWEKIKTKVGPDHPARYALVEVENVHDEALNFEPIHRVLFGVRRNVLVEMQAAFGENYRYVPSGSPAEMVEQVDAAKGPHQVIGVISAQGAGIIHIANSPTNLPVGTLQGFLDAFLKSGGAEKIDYVHGEEVTMRLGSQPGNTGFYLPAMSKSDLFKTVILDGALPRKTFSMGEAHEKRFYVEARKIA